MFAPPARTSLVDTYPNPSNAVAAAGMGSQYDYVTSIPFGQCRLVKSGANLVLQRYQGGWLTINGVVRAIPTGGVSLAATGLTPSTLYYIYAWMNGATMTLEASTTGHSTDTNTAVEIKTGDATRTLVGMARPITGPAWQDAVNQRFVVSWFNQRLIQCRSSLSTSTANSGTSYSEINANNRCEFLVWASSSGLFAYQGSASNNVLNIVSSTQLSLDGVAGESFNAAATDVVNRSFPVAASLALDQPSEGYHYVTAFARQNSAGSSTTYVGGSGPSDRCVCSGVIQG